MKFINLKYEYFVDKHMRKDTKYEFCKQIKNQRTNKKEKRVQVNYENSN